MPFVSKMKEYNEISEQSHEEVDSLFLEVLDEISEEDDPQQSQPLSGDNFHLPPDNNEGNSSSPSDKGDNNRFGAFLQQGVGLINIIEGEFQQKRPEFEEYLRKGYNIRGVDRNALSRLEAMLHSTSSVDNHPAWLGILMEARRYLQNIARLADPSETSPEIQEALDQANDMTGNIRVALEALDAAGMVGEKGWAAKVDEEVNRHLHALAGEAITRLNAHGVLTASSDDYIRTKNELMGLMSSKGNEFRTENAKFSKLKHSLLAEDRVMRIKMATYLDSTADRLLDGARDAREYALRYLHIRVFSGNTPPDSSGPQKRDEPVHIRIARLILPVTAALMEVAATLRQQSADLRPVDEESPEVYQDPVDEAIALIRQTPKKLRTQQQGLYFATSSVGTALKETVWKARPLLGWQPAIGSDGVKSSVKETGLLLLDELHQIERRLRLLPTAAWELQESVEQHQSLLAQTVYFSPRHVLNAVLDEQLDQETVRWKGKIQRSEDKLTELIAPVILFAQEKWADDFYYGLSEILREKKSDKGEWQGIDQFDGVMTTAINKIAIIARDIEGSAVRLARHGHAGGQDLRKEVQRWLRELSLLKGRVSEGVARITGESLSYYSRAGMLARGVAEWAEDLKQSYLRETEPKNPEAAAAEFEQSLMSVVRDNPHSFRKKTDPGAERFQQRLKLELKHAARHTTTWPATPEEILAGTRTLPDDIKRWAQKKVVSGAISAAIRQGFKVVSSPASLPGRLVLRSARTGLEMFRGIKAIERGVKFGQGPATRIKAQFIENQLSRGAFRLTMSLSPLVGLGVSAAITVERLFREDKYARKFVTETLTDLPEDMLWRGGYAGVNQVFNAVYGLAKEKAATEQMHQILEEYNRSNTAAEIKLHSSVKSPITSARDNDAKVSVLGHGSEESSSKRKKRSIQSSAKPLHELSETEKEKAAAVQMKAYLDKYNNSNAAEDIELTSGVSAHEEPLSGINKRSAQSSGSPLYELELSDAEIEDIVKNTPKAVKWENYSEDDVDFAVLKWYMDGKVKQGCRPYAPPEFSPAMEEGDVLDISYNDEYGNLIREEYNWVYLSGQYWNVRNVGGQELSILVGDQAFSINPVPGGAKRWKFVGKENIKAEYFLSRLVKHDGEVFRVLREDANNIIKHQNVDFDTFALYLDAAISRHITKASDNGDEIIMRAFQRVNTEVENSIVDLRRDDSVVSLTQENNYQPADVLDREQQSGPILGASNYLYDIPGNLNLDDNQVIDYLSKINKADVQYYRGLEKCIEDVSVAEGVYSISLHQYFKLKGVSKDKFDSEDDILNDLKLNSNNEDRDISDASKKCIVDLNYIKSTRDKLREYIEGNKTDAALRYEFSNIAEDIDSRPQIASTYDIKIQDLQSKIKIVKEELDASGGGYNGDMQELAKLKFKAIHYQWLRKIASDEAASEAEDDRYSKLIPEYKSLAYYNAMKYVLLKIENDKTISPLARINAYEARIGKERVTSVDIYGYELLNCFFIPDSFGAKTGVLVDLDSPKEYSYIEGESDLSSALEERLPSTSIDGHNMYTNGPHAFRDVKSGDFKFEDYFNYTPKARTDIISLSDQISKAFDDDKEAAESRLDSSAWVGTKKVAHYDEWVKNKNVIKKSISGLDVSDSGFLRTRTLYSGEGNDILPWHIKIMRGIERPAETISVAVQKNKSIANRESQEQAQINIKAAARKGQWIDATLSAVIIFIPGGATIGIAQASSAISADILEGKDPDTFQVASLAVNLIPEAKVAKAVGKFSKAGAKVAKYSIIFGKKSMDAAGLGISIKTAIETGDPLHIYQALLNAGISSKDAWYTARRIFLNVKMSSPPPVDSFSVKPQESRQATPHETADRTVPSHRPAGDERNMPYNADVSSADVRIPPAERIHPFTIRGTIILGRKKNETIEISRDNGMTWKQGNNIHMLAYVLQNAGGKSALPDAGSPAIETSSAGTSTSPGSSNEQGLSDALERREQPDNYFQNIKKTTPDESVRSFKYFSSYIRGRVRDGVFEMSKDGDNK
ncbi:hypothetical protein EDF81_4312 [Enterobacter sp. BIGb0383]|uniref:hypothetical protein n=1 Tax=unclassified Enterobacter TaxID=2608935 RepID=UPI000F484F99|nr:MULTISPECIES: hypothetical protein [unclassified Enterobacter]ROP50086.1 hypothetical protein EDF81_4312 [Enterobacter sp. BIGb0383]ROS06171.1 hypothetical protein EC848_3495 [Enterobacter sp. BIGb0359]